LSKPRGHSSQGISAEQTTSTFENGEASAAVVRAGHAAKRTVRTSVMSLKNLAHLSRGCLAIPPGKRDGHGSANPEVAFFQMGRNSLPRRGAIRKKVPKEIAKLDSKRPERDGTKQKQRPDRTLNGARCGRRSSQLLSLALGARTKAITGVTVKVAIKSPCERVAVGAGHGSKNLTLDAPAW